MNGDLTQFVLSLVAVAGLVGFVHLTGSSSPPILDGEREARELAALVPGGCVAAQVALDRAGAGAVVLGSDGQIVVVRPHGAHFVAMPVDRGLVRVAGDMLTAQSGAGSSAGASTRASAGASAGAIVLDIGSEAVMRLGLSDRV